MNVVKTVFNRSLLPPDSYTVEIDGVKANFNRGEESKVGEFIKSLWAKEEDLFGFSVYSPAYVYYNIGWDNDHVLYAKYERID